MIFDASRHRVQILGGLKKTVFPSRIPNLADLKLKRLADLFGKTI